MGAAQSSAAACLRAHEPLLDRLAGPDAIAAPSGGGGGSEGTSGGGDTAADAFFAALLSPLGGTSSSPTQPAALATLPPADVEAFLAPHVRRLLANNPRTRNWQSVLARFGPLVADRAAEAMAKLARASSSPPARPSADEAARRAAYSRDALAAANAMHLVAAVIKVAAAIPEEEGGGSAGLARLFAAPHSHAAATHPPGHAHGPAAPSSPSPSSLAPAFASQVATLLANSPPCPLLLPAAAASTEQKRRRQQQRAAWAEGCYLPVLEAARLSLALAATQLHSASPASPPGSNPLLEALFEGLGRGAPGAGALAAQLLRLAVARPAPPAALKPHAPLHPGAALLLGEGRPAPPAPGGSRSAVARVFWGARCAAEEEAAGGAGNGKARAANAANAGTTTTTTTDEAGSAGCGGPVGDASLLLLLLLLHFPAHHAGLGENCVRQALYDLEDEDEDDGVPSAGASPPRGPPIVPAAAPPPVVAAINGYSHSPASPHVLKGGKKFALRIPFSALLAHFSQPAETEAGTLLLYSLLHGNRAFRERALASSPDERAALLLPLLRALYGATAAPATGGAAAAAAAPATGGAAAAAAAAATAANNTTPLPPFLASSPNHLYMLQIVLLILSQDQAFAANVHAPCAPLGGLLPASAVGWYSERRLAAGGAPRRSLSSGGGANGLLSNGYNSSNGNGTTNGTVLLLNPGSNGITKTTTSTTTNDGVTLGSLLFAVLLRSAAHSFGAAALAADLYLPTNTLAALANLAPHARGLHPHAAQRLVGLAASLGKRYLRARRALERRRTKEGGDGSSSAGGGDAEAAGTSAGGGTSLPAAAASSLTEEQVNVLGDFLRIVLEIVNAVLVQQPSSAVAAAAAGKAAGATGASSSPSASASALPPSALLSGVEGNPELVYAVMHRRDALAELRECPRVQELADNILRVGEFFSARLAADAALASGLDAAAAAAAALAPHEHPLPADWGVERVLESILRAAPTWTPAGLRAFADLRFVYEEEEHPEEFFVPYAWAVSLAGTAAAGLFRWDLRCVSLLLQAQLGSQAGSRAESEDGGDGDGGGVVAGVVQGQQQQQQQQEAALAAVAAADAASAAAAAASAAVVVAPPRSSAATAAAVPTLAPMISGALSSEFSLLPHNGGGGGVVSSFPSLPTLREEEPAVVAPAGGGGGGWFGRWFG